MVTVALIFAQTAEAVRMGFSCYHCGAEFYWRMHLGRRLCRTHSRSSKRAADGLPDAVAGRADVVVTAHSPCKRARPQRTPSRARGRAGLAGVSRTADRSRQRGNAGESRITTDKNTDKDVDESQPKDAFKDSSHQSSMELHQGSDKNNVEDIGGARDVHDDGDFEQPNEGEEMRPAEDDISHDNTWTVYEASPLQCIDAEAQEHDSDLEESDDDEAEDMTDEHAAVLENLTRHEASRNHAEVLPGDLGDTLCGRVMQF